MARSSDQRPHRSAVTRDYDCLSVRSGVLTDTTCFFLASGVIEHNRHPLVFAEQLEAPAYGRDVIPDRLKHVGDLAT